LNLKQFKNHGEAGSVKVSDANEAAERLRQITDKYALEDIFNFDETGPYYRIPPDHGLSQEQLSGLKSDEIRILYSIGVNATGSEKWEPFIIAHHQRPRCFQRKSGKQLGFDYHWNTKAWMTGTLFQG
jgi:hypothetical protein